MKKKEDRDRKRKPWERIIISICVLAFLFSFWQIVKIFSEYKKGENFYRDAVEYFTVDSAEEENEPPIEVDFAELVAVNRDIVGWIYIEDTVVNYPILQGEDNFYYLDKTYEKKYLASGSIFLDAVNQQDFTDSHSIIYGHNMRNNTCLLYTSRCV